MKVIVEKYKVIRFQLSSSVESNDQSSFITSLVSLPKVKI